MTRSWTSLYCKLTTLLKRNALPVAPVNRVEMSSERLVRIVSQFAQENRRVPPIWSRKILPILTTEVLKSCTAAWSNGVCRSVPTAASRKEPPGPLPEQHRGLRQADRPQPAQLIAPTWLPPANRPAQGGARGGGGGASSAQQTQAEQLGRRGRPGARHPQATGQCSPRPGSRGQRDRG